MAGTPFDLSDFWDVFKPLKEWRVFEAKFRKFKLGKHEQIVQEME